MLTPPPSIPEQLGLGALVHPDQLIPPPLGEEEAEFPPTRGALKLLERLSSSHVRAEAFKAETHLCFVVSVWNSAAKPHKAF